MRGADVVKEVLEGFEEHNMSPVAVYSEDSSTIIRFKGTNENDCSLSVVISAGRVIVHRVIGKSTVLQDFYFQDIDDGFFEMVKDHYDTIRGLISMRDSLLEKN
jgi:hypothetical protein